MFPLILSFFSGPKNILIGLAVVAFLGAGAYVMHFVHEYNVLQQNNYTLQQNLTIEQNALEQQKKAAATQAQEAQTSLDSVRTELLQKQRRLNNLQYDNQALLALRTPTSEDNKCVTTPYVSVILDRLRRRSAGATDVGSGSSGDATAAAGANNIGPTTSDP